jgi:hypothetical protein
MTGPLLAGRQGCSWYPAATPLQTINRHRARTITVHPSTILQRSREATPRGSTAESVVNRKNDRQYGRAAELACFLL